MTSPFEYAQQHAGRFLDELKDLLRIPSISADPDFAGDCKRTADWLANELRRLGLQAEVIPTELHPLVYAEWLKAGPDAPTLLVYGHYDVQPAFKEDGWDSEPFEPVERNGKLYARGVTDDKGQLYIHVKAVESILASENKLPLNVKFILEGEEEFGGKSIADFTAKNKERLQADVCVISDSGFEQIDQPMIVSSIRGIVSTELRVSGPGSDLHSGMYGGTVHNPSQALAEIIAKLHHPDGSVAVAGFYDDVKLLTAVDREEFARVPFTEAQWRHETGSTVEPWGEAEYSLRERIGARPTLEINGIAGGYAGAGFKTVIGQTAIAKISCRLVANQDPQRIFELLRDHIARITPKTAKSELVFLDGGYPASIDITHPALQAASVAYEKGWGNRPVFMPEGGSIPIVADFQKLLGLPVVMMGYGLSTDNLHAPNEHWTISMFHQGIETAIHFMYEVAKLQK